jgi:hypothetical protein
VHYEVLKASFGLADEAVALSNGVTFTVSYSTDGGLSFTDLIKSEITSNTWRSELLDLPPTDDLMLKLNVSAKQDATYDWLQIKINLVPTDREVESAEITGYFEAAK